MISAAGKIELFGKPQEILDFVHLFNVYGQNDDEGFTGSGSIGGSTGLVKIIDEAEKQRDLDDTQIIKVEESISANSEYEDLDIPVDNLFHKIYEMIANQSNKTDAEKAVEMRKLDTLLKDRSFRVLFNMYETDYAGMLYHNMYKLNPQYDGARTTATWLEAFEQRQKDNIQGNMRVGGQPCVIDPKVKILLNKSLRMTSSNIERYNLGKSEHFMDMTDNIENGWPWLLRYLFNEKNTSNIPDLQIKQWSEQLFEIFNNMYFEKYHKRFTENDFEYKFLENHRKAGRIIGKAVMNDGYFAVFEDVEDFLGYLVESYFSDAIPKAIDEILNNFVY